MIPQGPIVAYRSIWTPAAELLCGICHGSRRTPSGRLVDTSGDRPELFQKGYRTTCDRCHVPICGDDDATALRSLGLPYAQQLRQTGGMCAALFVRLMPPAIEQGRDVADCFSVVAVISMLDGPLCATMYEVASHSLDDVVDVFEGEPTHEWCADDAASWQMQRGELVTQLGKWSRRA